MYREGGFVVRDFEKALKWYRLSAEQGYAFAESNLGFMYEEGQGVSKDYKEAHMWFNLCGSQGSKQCLREKNNLE
jgi:uncharacterized protein